MLSKPQVIIWYLISCHIEANPILSLTNSNSTPRRSTAASRPRCSASTASTSSRCPSSSPTLPTPPPSPRPPQSRAPPSTNHRAPPSRALSPHICSGCSCSHSWSAPCRHSRGCRRCQRRIPRRHLGAPRRTCTGAAFRCRPTSRRRRNQGCTYFYLFYTLYTQACHFSVNMRNSPFINFPNFRFFFGLNFLFLYFKFFKVVTRSCVRLL